MRRKSKIYSFRLCCVSVKTEVGPESGAAAMSSFFLLATEFEFLVGVNKDQLGDVTVDNIFQVVKLCCLNGCKASILFRGGKIALLPYLL